MVAAEGLADRRERAFGQLAAEVHCDLAAKRYVLSALFRLKLSKPNMKEIGHGPLDRFDVGFDVMCANEIAQSLAGELRRYCRFAHRSECSKTRKASLELTHVRGDVLRDVKRDLGQQLHIFECRLLLQNGYAGFEVRRCDIGDQTRLEAIAQPLFESRNIARNLIRSQHDLMTLGVERVEGMKEFLLGALAAGQELDVVKNQGVDAAELFLELAHPVAPERADQLVHENLGRHGEYFARPRLAGPQVMPDGRCQVHLSESDTTIDEERVVFFAGLIGDRQRRRVRELITRPDDEFSEGVALAEIRIKSAAFGLGQRSWSCTIA